MDGGAGEWAPSRAAPRCIGLQSRVLALGCDMLT